MATFEQHVAEEDGWSRWIFPIHGCNTGPNYKLACCDCSLVHDVQFRTVRDKQGRISVKFKVRRNNRSTGQLRRKARNDSALAKKE